MLDEVRTPPWEEPRPGGPPMPLAPPMPPGAPIDEADSGPPAGKVLLVGWPRVSTDQIAGPTRRIAIPPTRAARRRRPVPKRSARAAAIETTTIGMTSQSRSEALLPMTT